MVLRDKIYNTIKERITSGKYAPGQPLDEKQIIEELRSGALAGVAERSGRAQDQEDGGGLETLRRDGYM